MPSRYLNQKILKRKIIIKILTVESLLDVIILTDDKSDSSLRIFNVGELVEVSLPLEQSIDSLGVSVVRSVVQSSPLSVVQGHDVGVLLQKELDALETALPASQVQRGALLLISRLLVGSACQQRLANIYVVVQGCEVQRGLKLV